MPQFDAYKAISLRIWEIFAAYTPIIEPLSLDEGYLDGTSQRRNTQVRLTYRWREPDFEPLVPLL